MTRFFLSPAAQRDIDEIRMYLEQGERGADRRAVASLLKTFKSIAEWPFLGIAHSNLGRLLGTEVRSRLSQPYRIYYRLGRSAPEILAILHTSRDHAAILENRLQ